MDYMDSRMINVSGGVSEDDSDDDSWDGFKQK